MAVRSMLRHRVACGTICALGLAGWVVAVAGCNQRSAPVHATPSPPRAEIKPEAPQDLGLHLVPQIKHVKIDGIGNEWQQVPVVWTLEEGAGAQRALLKRVQFACDAEFAYFFLTCDVETIQATASNDLFKEIEPLFSIFFPQPFDDSVIPAPPLERQLRTAGRFGARFDLGFSMKYPEHNPAVHYSLRYPASNEDGREEPQVWLQHPWREGVVAIFSFQNITGTADNHSAMELTDSKSPWVGTGRDGIEVAFPHQGIKFQGEKGNRLLLIHNRRSWHCDDALAAAAFVELKFPNGILATENPGNNQENP